MEWLVEVVETRKRRRELEDLFGGAVLPVMQPLPQTFTLDTGRAITAYELDAGRLHPAQLDRLAARMARKTGRPYAQVRESLRSGGEMVPIEADGTRVLTGRE